jgi:hypothetical protein
MWRRSTVAAARRQLEVGAGPRDGEEHAVVPVVIVEPADLNEADAVAVEPDDRVQALRVPRDPQLHCSTRRLAKQVERQPDPVAQRDAVDVDVGVARFGREGVALHAQQSKPEPLIEAQHARVGRRGRDEESGAALLATHLHCARDQHPANAKALSLLAHGEALDLGLVLAVHELQMADDGRPVAGHEHPPEIAVGAHRRRRVTGQGEQLGEWLASAFEPVDRDVRHCGLLGPFRHPSRYGRRARDARVRRCAQPASSAALSRVGSRLADARSKGRWAGVMMSRLGCTLRGRAGARGVSARGPTNA